MGVVCNEEEDSKSEAGQKYTPEEEDRLPERGTQGVT